MPLAVQYDPVLVALSVAVAMIGSYTGLHTAQQIVLPSGRVRKGVLAASAVAIGSAIWSMHFIGMLAVHLPILISYDVLTTLISALVSILVTGVGLACTQFSAPSGLRLALGGLCMGLGIATMHYVGMAAMRGNCVLSYAPGLVGLSVLIGVLAATLSLWLVRRRARGWRIFAAAGVMGLAISGMHYTAMSGTAFLPAADLAISAQPNLDQAALAIAVAATTFLILGFAILCALPKEVALDDAPLGEAVAPAGDVRVPVERNKAKHFLATTEIVAVQADGHYTTVFTGNDSYFCSLSISELEALLDRDQFLRVHRSHIVNLRAVEAFERKKEQGIVLLKGLSAHPVPVSRTNVVPLRRALQI